ncbi:unnamed protein product [Haemonchus placei]|uniref:Uncharacterized protein n=1 Tax=Haemonchus placei TaxID=6290 RepID=A0A0N4WS73_HAEPC|nr:unnamed protein product [Haemonchus placei]
MVRVNTAAKPSKNTGRKCSTRTSVRSARQNCAVKTRVEMLR